MINKKKLKILIRTKLFQKSILSVTVLHSVYQMSIII
jgi:hypothetical protein